MDETGTKPPTLEQHRSRDAWRISQERRTKSYANLAKRAPALIMGNGLLQTLAFLEDKGHKKSQPHCRELGHDLRAWLCVRFPELFGGNGADPATEPHAFRPFMEALVQCDSRSLQRVTREALDWLRWLRQMAAASVGPDAKDPSS